MTGPNKASRGGGLPGERKPWADIEAMVPHHRFWGEEEVEATARCMRWTDRFGNYDEGWVTAAELAIRMGIAQFPDSYRLSMLYANFLIDVRRSGAQGTNVLARVKKMSANMDVRFQGFCRDREQTQRGGSGSVGAEGAMDLVSFVEFHNNFKSVQVRPGPRDGRHLGPRDPIVVSVGV